MELEKTPITKAEYLERLQEVRPILQKAIPNMYRYGGRMVKKIASLLEDTLTKDPITCCVIYLAWKNLILKYSNAGAGK